MKRPLVNLQYKTVSKDGKGINKNLHDKIYAWETHSRNLNENEKATIKYTAKPNFPTINETHKVNHEFLEPETTMLPIRGFSFADTWVNSPTNPNDSIKGPWGHEPGGATQTSKRYGKQCKKLWFETIM